MATHGPSRRGQIPQVSASDRLQIGAFLVVAETTLNPLQCLSIFSRIEVMAGQFLSQEHPITVEVSCLRSSRSYLRRIDFSALQLVVVSHAETV